MRSSCTIISTQRTHLGVATAVFTRNGFSSDDKNPGGLRPGTTPFTCNGFSPVLRRCLTFIWNGVWTVFYKGSKRVVQKARRASEMATSVSQSPYKSGRVLAANAYLPSVLPVTLPLGLGFSQVLPRKRSQPVCLGFRKVFFYFFFKFVY